MSSSAFESASTGAAPWSSSQRCFVIAEAGVNHNGDLGLAMKLIDAAVASGADAVKFQTFCAEKVAALSAAKAEYQMAATGAEESQLAMIKKLELPHASFHKLKLYCEESGIIFLSTPFDEESADFLDSIGVIGFKTSSGELTNLDFLQHVARKQKPMIVSTGMAELTEVRAAVDAIRAETSAELVLLHCISNYPANPASVNLRAMQTLKQEFGCAVGFSDHTMGIEIALAASSLGARVIEKHITLDRKMAGPDHSASLEPQEFAAMVHGIRKIECALGDGIKHPAAEELPVMQVARRSLVASRDIPAGTTLAAEHIAVLRPGTGMAPAMRKSLIGRNTRRDVRAGTLFTHEMLQ